MQNFRKNVNGITLMALVVTIIILLILAGISIGMLSGDNSTIKQAGNAKTQTDIAQEKEILEQATIVAMGKSKYGNVEKSYLDIELNKTPGSENYSSKNVSKGIEVKFTSSNRRYLVDNDGNVSLRVISKISSILVNDLTMTEGETKEIEINVTPSEDIEDLIYISSNEDLLTVDENGNMTAKNLTDDKKEDTVMITIKGVESGKEATCTVTIKEMKKITIGDYVNYSVDYESVPTYNNAYKPDSKYDGKWRVLSANNGNIKLISAGVPLTYYHSNNSSISVTNLTTGFFSTNFGNSGTTYRSSGFKNGNTVVQDITEIKNLFKNAKGTALDGNTPKVSSLTKEDIESIAGDFTTGIDLTQYADLLIVPCNTNNAGSYAWTFTRNSP